MTRVILAASVMLLSIVALVVAESASVTIYMYGVSWCPHCRNMKTFLGEKYPGIFTYCEVDTVEACSRAFTEWLKETGLPGYVPQTLIVKNGRITAVIIGEVLNESFINNLVSLEPGESIPVYQGTQLYGMLNTSKINTTLVLYTPSSPSENTRSGITMVEALVITMLVAIIVVPIGYTVLKRMPRRPGQRRTDKTSRKKR
ncbi:MAG: hypothetical protein OWQ48_05575 [Desulfurococcus sp.]|nr:hypothetical protein [Desulfurococcus sp.]